VGSGDHERKKRWQAEMVAAAPNDLVSRKQVLDAVLQAERDYGGCNATFELTDVVLRMKAAK